MFLGSFSSLTSINKIGSKQRENSFSFATRTKIFQRQIKPSYKILKNQPINIYNQILYILIKNIKKLNSLEKLCLKYDTKKSSNTKIHPT